MCERDRERKLNRKKLRKTIINQRVTCNRKKEKENNETQKRFRKERENAAEIIRRKKMMGEGGGTFNNYQEKLPEFSFTYCYFVKP